VNTHFGKCNGIYFYVFLWPRHLGVDPSGRGVQGVGLRPLACWDYGFESRLGMDVSYDCCVLSDGGLCVGLIIRSEDSYQVWRV